MKYEVAFVAAEVIEDSHEVIVELPVSEVPVVPRTGDSVNLRDQNYKVVGVYWIYDGNGQRPQASGNCKVMVYCDPDCSDDLSQ